MNCKRSIWNHFKLETCYYNSEFIGGASAEEMIEKFHSCKVNLGFGNSIQLSKDGTSVKWKFYKMVEAELKNEYCCNLLKHEGALYKEVFPGKTYAHLSLTVDVHRSNSKWQAI